MFLLTGSTRDASLIHTFSRGGFLDAFETVGMEDIELKRQTDCVKSSSNYSRANYIGLIKSGKQSLPSLPEAIYRCELSVEEYENRRKDCKLNSITWNSKLYTLPILLPTTEIFRH